MPLRDALLPEFDHEMASTRKVLERVPDADAAWRPHPKSWSLGDLSAHLANIPYWGSLTLTENEYDLAPPGGSAPRRKFEGTAANVKDFDGKVSAARVALAAASDADLMAPWTLKKGGKNMFTLPRVAVLRSLVLSHMIHHRGQLTVYLRLRDVPLPNLYGPTADEA